MENLITHTYHVGGMSCGGCVASVKKKLSEVPEVISVEINLANKKAEVTSTREIGLETLQKALSKTPYRLQ